MTTTAKPAKQRKPRKPASDNGMTLTDAAFRALAEVGVPLSLADLWSAILAKQLWTPPRGGRTPGCSLRACIYRNGDGNGEEV